MVQQTTDKFTEQGLFSSRNATDFLQKYHPVSINIMTLRDLPNESDSIMKPVTAQPNETRTNSNLTKLVGAKRQQPDCSSSPAARYQTPATNCSPGHLVYVRRKLETEHGKINAAPNGDAACSSGPRKSTNEATEKTELQQEQNGKSKVGAIQKTEIQQEQNGKSKVGVIQKTEIQQEQNGKSSSEITEKTEIQQEQNGKSSNELAEKTAIQQEQNGKSSNEVTEKTEIQEEQTGKCRDEATEKTEVQQKQAGKSKDGPSKTTDEPPRDTESLREVRDTESLREVSSSYWTERFNRLQEFLQYLDQSGSKDYAEKFGTFSIEDLNKLAVNLEKRAIRLTLEEALLSQRAKDLNLLGRSSQ